MVPLVLGLIMISYLLADKYGTKRKAGFWQTFLISLAFSPIVGWIFAWAKGVKSENTTIKENSQFNKTTLYTAITLFSFIIFTSLIYVYNPKNILENIGLRTNPKILNTQVTITENPEMKEKYTLLVRDLESRKNIQFEADRKIFLSRHAKDDLNNPKNWMGYDASFDLELMDLEEHHAKAIDGWDCEIKVDIKNEGKSGMILVRAEYWQDIKEESLILERNQYRTLYFHFRKTKKNGAHIVKIQSLE